MKLTETDDITKLRTKRLILRVGMLRRHRSIALQDWDRLRIGRGAGYSLDAPDIQALDEIVSHLDSKIGFHTTEIEKRGFLWHFAYKRP